MMFWTLIAVLPIAVDSFGCGCCLPKLPPLTLPPLPPLPPLPTLPPLCLPSPCCCKSSCCGRRKRDVSKSVITVSSTNRTCNDEALRHIILKESTPNPVQAASLIYKTVRKKLGGKWVVACGGQPLSFTGQSKRYCLDGHADTWCYVFQID
ncbi:hypothetical protein KIN20_033398 [Parelaphostrongylus tenuis]|uniref:Ground-like domain-containing protein n=1 Tax=Parelaphostrongylus tenuis TaxID=148309 RepID=A0AAD5R8L3_PARTN|nr:hypothetical protein KIN20_033398 [Parelaphostrongylus tenuis]